MGTVQLALPLSAVQEAAPAICASLRCLFRRLRRQHQQSAPLYAASFGGSGGSTSNLRLFTLPLSAPKGAEKRQRQLDALLSVELHALCQDQNNVAEMQGRNKLKIQGVPLKKNTFFGTACKNDIDK